jgi:hypothetical protein
MPGLAVFFSSTAHFLTGAPSARSSYGLALRAFYSGSLS